MVRAVACLALAAPAVAFVVPAVPQARSDVRMSAERKAQPMGAVFRGLAAASILASPLAGLSSSALASSGDSPKISVFGLGGTKADISSPFVEDATTYSPYSPYGTGKDALFKPLNADDVAFFKKKVAEAQKRFGKVESFIAKKQWEEIRSELTRQGPDFRGSVRKLVANKGTESARVAAETLFQDLEDLTVSSRRKQGAEASAAFVKAKAHLEALVKEL